MKQIILNKETFFNFIILMKNMNNLDKILFNNQNNLI